MDFITLIEDKYHFELLYNIDKLTHFDDKQDFKYFTKLIGDI